MVVFQELIICLHSSLSKGVPLTTFDDWILLLTSDNSNANTEDSGNFQEAFMKQVKYLVTPLLLMGLFLTSFSFGPPEQNQVRTTTLYCQG